MTKLIYNSATGNFLSQGGKLIYGTTATCVCCVAGCEPGCHTPMWPAPGGTENITRVGYAGVGAGGTWPAVRVAPIASTTPAPNVLYEQEFRGAGNPAITCTFRSEFETPRFICPDDVFPITPNVRVQFDHQATFDDYYSSAPSVTPYLEITTIGGTPTTYTVDPYNWLFVDIPLSNLTLANFANSFRGVTVWLWANTLPTPTRLVVAQMLCNYSLCVAEGETAENEIYWTGPEYGGLGMYNRLFNKR